MPNNARYKFKVGELVLCKFIFDYKPVEVLGLVVGRVRERDQWWMENMYDLLLQQSYRDDKEVTRIHIEEKYLSKVK